MNNSDDKRWLNFKIQDIFNIGTGASIPKKNLIAGTIPRISVTSINNGIMGFFDTSKAKNERIFKNVISVTFLGNDGPIFYHNYEASFDMKVHSLSLKNHKLDKNIALFLISILAKSFNGFNYGNQLSSSDLKDGNIKLMLPVNSNNQPDWQFMEDYISEKMGGYNVPSLETSGVEPLSLRDRKWNSFELQQILDEIVSVKGKNIDNYSYGSIPYITTTSFNNGLASLVSGDENEISSKNVLTIDPIKGKTFYHPYNFIGRGGAGSAINVLKSSKFNKYRALFLSKVIEFNSAEKASYGTQLNGKRLRKQKIMLPVDNNNQPDWQFMEDYMKSLPYANLL